MLLCQEEDGAIHILDHRVWTTQAALTFFTSQIQSQNSAVAAQSATGGPGTYADVIQRSKNAQAGGQPQPYQADHAPDPGDNSRKKDKKKKKGQEKKGGTRDGAKGQDKKGGIQDDAGKGKADQGRGKGGGLHLA